MRGEEAVVVTPVAAPEAGRDGEQLRPAAGLGSGARGEPGGGGPQESRKQCEFPASRGPCAGGRAAWRTAERGTAGNRGLAEAAEVWGGGGGVDPLF